MAKAPASKKDKKGTEGPAALLPPGLGPIASGKHLRLRAVLGIFSSAEEPAAVTRLYVSDDETRLLACSSEGGDALWDLPAAAAVRTFNGRGERVVGALARRAPLAAVVEGMRLSLVDLESKKELWKAKHGFEIPQDACGVALTGEGGSVFVCGGEPLRIRAFDGRTGRVRGVLQVQNEPSVMARLDLDVSDDGRLGVIAGGDSVALWDPVSMSMLRTLKHEGVGGACVSSDGHRIISSGWDWKVRVWDARGGKQLASWGHARGTVGGIAISADGELALSCGTMDGTVTLRRAGSGKAVETLVAKKDRGYVSSAVFSHDGRTLYLGHRRGAIMIFSVTP